MSSVALQGNASGAGAFVIASPNSSSNRTLTLPDATTTLVGTDATQTLTNKTLTSPTITGAVVSSMASTVITAATAVASTSGTSIDFTGLPSWVKRITVLFEVASTNGTSDILVQLGDSGGVETTGYLGSSADGPTLSATAYTTGFGVRTGSAAVTLIGSISISNITSNTWVASGVLTRGSGALFIATSGSKTLTATLDRVRITTVTGTDTFDAGTVNIFYE
jgi:hypothetical protein